jgi:hypothetical protein
MAQPRPFGHILHVPQYALTMASAPRMGSGASLAASSGIRLASIRSIAAAQSCRCFGVLVGNAPRMIANRKARLTVGLGNRRGILSSIVGPHLDSVNQRILRPIVKLRKRERFAAGPTKASLSASGADQVIAGCGFGAEAGIPLPAQGYVSRPNKGWAVHRPELPPLTFEPRAASPMPVARWSRLSVPPLGVPGRGRRIGAGGPKPATFPEVVSRQAFQRLPLRYRAHRLFQQPQSRREVTGLSAFQGLQVSSSAVLVPQT